MSAPSSALARLQASRAKLAHAVGAGALNGRPVNPLHLLMQTLLFGLLRRLFQPKGMAATGETQADESLLGKVLGDKLSTELQQHPVRSLALAAAGGALLLLLRPWRWRAPPSWALAALTQSLLPWWLAQTSATSTQPSPPRTPP